ncbi:MAG: DUF5011 domain-containing protein [Candidatus Yonathbacteria bacterium]|nr:DUF5011 domain-containing protein [Candidatus Yonathbacteria bacterium]NTW48082.1 DUF5011 domain-containing protein [Candidatus Yonathbacteria bacterium]
MFVTFLIGVSAFVVVRAAFNPEINYQGKLTNTSNVAVNNGDYNIRFRLYTVPSGGSPLWTETLCYSPDAGTTCDGTGVDNRPEISSGLFSVLLGAVSSLASVNFDQTLYLGVEIGGSSSTPTWDGEMTPRKKLGAVPAAFEAGRLDGIDSASFLRSDEPDTMAVTSASTALTITQSGTGDILNINDGASEVFTILDGGNVGIGTITPGQKLTVDGTLGILEGGTTPTYHTIFQGGDQAGDVTYTLPTAQAGGSGYVLSNNGSGILSWVAGGGGGGMAIGGAVTSGTLGSILFVDASGNLAQDNTNFFWNNTDKRLGIGTNTPNEALDVNGTIQAKKILFYDDTITGKTHSNISFSETEVSPTVTDLLLDSDTGTDFRFIMDHVYEIDFGTPPGGMSGFSNAITLGTTGTSSLRFNSGPQIYGGVGDALYLDSYHGTLVSNNSGDIVRFGTSSANTDTYFYGNVGIGTAVPDRRLDVLDATNPQLRLTYTDGSVYTDFQTTSAGDLYINPSGGSVGIGTALPTYPLEVSGGNLGAQMKITHSGVGYAPASILLEEETDFGRGQGIYQHSVPDGDSWFSGVPYGADGDLWGVFYKNDVVWDPSVASTAYSVLRVEKSGNIGLNTSAYLNWGEIGTSGYGLRDNGGVMQYKNSSGSWTNLSAGGGGMAIGSAVTSGTSGSVLFVDASGNLAQDNTNFFWNNTDKRLGIGTNTPAYDLDVAGSGYFRSKSGLSTVTESFEGVTFPPTSWTTGGDANWTRTTAEAQESAASANSGTITNSQIAWIDRDYTFTTTGEVKFYWKVSSETAYDYLLFCADNDLSCTDSSYTQRISGEVDWVEVTYVVSTPGVHSFRWVYSKDSGDPGVFPWSDEGWIDNVRFIESTGISGGNVFAEGYLSTGDSGVFIGSSTNDRGSILYDTTNNILAFDTDSVTNADVSFFSDNLYIDKSTEYIGIGDVTPDSVLDILSATASNTQLSIGNTNAGDYDPQIGFQLADGTTNIFTMGIDDSDSDKFKISGGSALGTNDRLVIDSSGNVGLGTAGPDRRLDVLDATNPQLRLTHTDGSMYTDFQTTSEGDITVTPSGGDLTFIGNILPGGTSGAYNLGSDTARWGDFYLDGETIHIGSSLTDEGIISYTSGNILSFDTDTTTGGDIAFFTDDIYLDKSTGYVGLSDTTPDHTLDVAGNIGLNTSSYINFGDTDGTDGYGFRDNGGTLQFKHNGGSWTNFGASSSSVTPRDFWSFNHFYYNGVSSMDPFFGAAISSGTIGAPTAASMASGNHPGAILVSKAASTTANSGYRITGLSTAMVLGGGYLFEGVINVRTPAAGTNTIYLGFHDATSVTAPVDGVYFDIAGTTVTGRSRGGSATLATASTYTVSTGNTDWYRFRIVINTAATRADFYIYDDAGTQVWTDYVSGNAGDLPTATADLLTAGFLGVNSSTTATAYEIANVDYMGMGTVAGYDAFTTGGSGLWTVNGSNVYYNAGNVGIGTTAPSQALSVSGTLGIIETGTTPQYYSIFQGGDQAGNITYTLPTAVGGAGQQLTDAAGNGVLSWAAAGSTRNLKDIDGLIEDPQEALETILETNIYAFHYKEGMGTGDAQTQYVGVMADEASWAMHYDGNVVNPVNTLGYMVLGMQATNKRIDDIIAGLASVSDSGGNSLSDTGMAVLYAPITAMLSNDPMNGMRIASILSSFIEGGDVGTSFWNVDAVTGVISPLGSLDMDGNGVYDVAEIIGIDESWSVNRQGLLTVNGLVVRGDIEVGSREKPSGITLYDEVTGEPYCLRMVAGVIESTLGTCESLRASSSDGGDMGDITPPTIVLRGNNPARIEIGDEYGDLGATVTDDNDEYPTLEIYIEGEKVDTVHIMAREDATYTIEYVAYDDVGNTSTVTRTVIVGNGSPDAQEESEVEDVPLVEIPPVAEPDPEPSVEEVIIDTEPIPEPVSGSGNVLSDEPQTLHE